MKYPGYNFAIQIAFKNGKPISHNSRLDLISPYDNEPMTFTDPDFSVPDIPGYPRREITIEEILNRIKNEITTSFNAFEDQNIIIELTGQIGN